MNYPAYVYVIKLANSTLYVGSTAALLTRMDQHLAGRGSIATQNSKPTEIVQIYPCLSREQAYVLESYLIHEQKYTRKWMPPLLRSERDIVRLHALAQQYRQRSIAWREAYYAARNVPRRKVQIVRGPVRLTTREIAAQALEAFINQLVK